MLRPVINSRGSIREKMQQVINQVNEKATAFLNGDTSIDPRVIMRELNEGLEREFGGWQVTGRTAVPRDPEQLIRQLPEDVREEIRLFLTLPHVKVGRKWHVMEPAYYPEDDMWEATPKKIERYTRARVRADADRHRCRACAELDENCDRHRDWPRLMIPGRESRELWDDDQWFNTVLLTIRGVFRRGVLMFMY